nr:MAG TPA: hypothetical protein [Caudoviricetes sp.]
MLFLSGVSCYNNIQIRLWGRRRLLWQCGRIGQIRRCIVLPGQCPQQRAGGKIKKRGESRCWI